MCVCLWFEWVLMQQIIAIMYLKGDSYLSIHALEILKPLDVTLCTRTRVFCVSINNFICPQ